MQRRSSNWLVTGKRIIDCALERTLEIPSSFAGAGEPKGLERLSDAPGSLLAGLLVPIFLYWIYRIEISFPSPLSQEGFTCPQRTGLRGGVTCDRCEVLCELQSRRAGGKPVLCPPGHG